MAQQPTGRQSISTDAAATIPPELGARLNTAGTLSDDDRAIIVQIARNVLMGFSPRTESNLKAKAGSEPETKTEFMPQGEPRPREEGEVEPKPKPAPKEKP